MAALECSALWRFFADHVAGVTLATEPTSYRLEEGKLEGEYSSRITFNRLTRTSSGFGFDLTMINSEILYPTGDDTEKPADERRKETVNVFRYELAERAATGQVTGTMLITATTAEHQQALAWGVCQVTLQDNEIRWKEIQILYRDMTYTTGRFRPVAQDAEARLLLRNGVLQFEYRPVLFEITDVATLERKASEDSLPVFVFTA